MSRALPALVATLLALPAWAERFAVVIGENTPQSTTLKPLKYADDDAIRHAALLRGLGVKVRVLTVPDAATQAVHPRIEGHAGAPTLARVREVLAEVDREVKAARARGQSTDLFFVFAGHGEVGPSKEGRLHLRDSFLTRQQLLDEVVGQSSADFKHLVLDACHAEALVYDRGEGEASPDFSNLIAGELAKADLSQHPDTGILLASSRDERTHEWAVFQAGVFSHELRSGLAGGADANLDGVIEYSELAAFVASANAGLRQSAAKATVVHRAPPLDRHRPLADVFQDAAHLLEIPAKLRGRIWVETDAGERYADVHPSGEAPMILALSGAARYYLRQGDREAAVAVRGPGRYHADALQWGPVRQGSRGAVEDALRRNLFAVPFGPSFYDGFVASTGSLRAVRHREAAAAAPGLQLGQSAATAPSRPGGLGLWLPIGLGATALVTVSAGVALGIAADHANDDFRDDVRQTGLDNPATRERIASQRDWANIFYVSAGVLAVGAVTTALINWDGPALSAAPTPGGAAAAVGWRW